MNRSVSVYARHASPLFSRQCRRRCETSVYGTLPGGMHLDNLSRRHKQWRRRRGIGPLPCLTRSSVPPREQLNQSIRQVPTCKSHNFQTDQPRQLAGIRLVGSHGRHGRSKAAQADQVPTRVQPESRYAEGEHRSHEEVSYLTWCLHYGSHANAVTLPDGSQARSPISLAMRTTW